MPAPGHAPAQTPTTSRHLSLRAPHEHLLNPQLRHQLRWVTVAWLFGSYWLWTISGAAMTQFSRALHMPDFAFGILATLPFIGTLIQVPASYALERFGHRKPVFIITGAVSRALWVLIAAIPWLLPNTPEWWWPTMAGLLLISWASANASSPAWMNWMSDLIPRQVRGRYFAIRNRLGRGMGMLVTLAVGYLLDQVAASHTGRPDLMLKATAAILAIGGLMGTLDILCFRFIPDAAPPAPAKHTQLLKLIHTPLKDKNFRRYLAFNFTFMLGLGFIGQYVWLYVFDVLGWSNWKANLLLLALPLLVQLLMYRLSGQLIDRLGKKPVLLITGVILGFGPLGFFLITPHHLALGYTLVLATTAAWPGMEIANFNIILGMAGSRKAERHKNHAQSDGSSAYVAVNAIAVALGGILSGLLSSLIADRLNHLNLPLHLLGSEMTLTYHRLLFLISAALRLAALLFAIRLIEPEAAATRDAIRYMTVSFYSNVRQAALMPSRVVGRAVRWSYRIKL